MGEILPGLAGRNSLAQGLTVGAKVLYISYDGLMEPLGQSQVVCYLTKLAKHHDITLVSYEKPFDWADRPRRDGILAKIREAGIRWRPLLYHKRPTALATSYDLMAGFLVCSYLVLRRRIQIVHARSDVPSVVALALKRICGTRFIFDMRGFWADERVDGGIWPADCLLYKVAKWFERQFLTRADVVVSLTHAGVSALRELPILKNKKPWFEVIPTCTDLERFCPASPNSADADSPARDFTVGIVGTVVRWNLLDPALDGFKTLCELRPGARLLIVNRSDHDYIRERLRAKGIPESSVEIKSVWYSEVPNEIRKMDMGVFFLKPGWSQQARSPTKLGEFLGCGVPCLSNTGVGDVAQILEGERVGVVLREFTRNGMEDAVQRALALASDPGVRTRCVKAAYRYFSLDAGVRSYDGIYHSLMKAPR